MLFSDVNRLLEPCYTSLETGYVRLVDGQILVAVLTRMPECKGSMVDWWFGFLDDSQKYRMWSPNSHIDFERQYKGHGSAGSYIGNIVSVTRTVGGIVRKNQIHYHHPSDFVDEIDSANSSGITIICANVYNPEKVLESRFIHCVRDTGYGCEMRSRIWLLNNASDEMAIDEMCHCLEEMGNLAVFLPELHKQNV